MAFHLILFFYMHSLIGKESFKLLYYEAESDFANSMMPTWDEETYRHIDVIAADKVFTDNNNALINTEVRSISAFRSGVYFAFYDRGSCLTLLSVRVYYITCPAVSVNFAQFPNTTTGAELTAIVQVRFFAVWYWNHVFTHLLYALSGGSSYEFQNV